MITADRITATQVLENARSSLEEAGEGIDALRDDSPFPGARLDDASAAVRTALDNVTLVLDGLRFQ